MLSGALRRVRAARASGDAGVTLTELLVAMGLATILGAITLQLFVSVNDSTAATTDRTVETAQARNTLQAWSGYLHVSDGTTPGSVSTRFEWLTTSDIAFYAGLNNRSGNVETTAAPVMYWLRIDANGQLVEEQFPSTATINALPTVCRILADKVTAGTTSGSSGLFTALDANGNALTGGGLDLGAAPTPSAGCRQLPVTVPSRSGTPDPVAVANLQRVSSLSIAFTLADTKGQHPLEFVSVATLPTLGGAS
jgi:type II secretory pathway component PulJ